MPPDNRSCSRIVGGLRRAVHDVGCPGRQRRHSTVMTPRPLRRIRNWWRRRRRRGPGYLYVGYHECATRFTERVLRTVCEVQELRAAKFDSLRFEVTEADLAETDFLMLTDYSSAMADLDRFSARGLYVARDPRDILVSMYVSHRFSHTPR